MRPGIPNVDLEGPGCDKFRQFDLGRIFDMSRAGWSVSGNLHAGTPPLNLPLYMIVKGNANAVGAAQLPREFIIELPEASFGLHPTHRTPYMGHFEHDACVSPPNR